MRITLWLPISSIRLPEHLIS